MYYELKKLFSSKYILLCLLILIGFFAVFVINAYKARKTYSEEYAQLLADISKSGKANENGIKEITLMRDETAQLVFEKGEAVSQTQGKYGSTAADDMILYSKACDEMKHIYIDFPQGRRRIVSDALTNIEQADSAKAKAENELVIDKYNRMIDMPLKDSGNLFDTLFFFDNTVWDYALIVFVIMLTVRVFSLDIASSAYQVVYSTAVKRKKLFVKAFFSVVLVTAAILIITSVCQVICGCLFFGVNDLSLPLQMTGYFELCPYLFSVLDYYIIKLMCKLLFYLAVISVSAFLTVISRRQALAMPLSVTGITAPLIIITYYFTLTTADNSNSSAEGFVRYKQLQAFLPQGLLNIKTYFNSFDYVYISGLFVPRIVCCALVTALITAISFTAALKNYGKPKR